MSHTFRRLDGLAAPLDVVNVDTDQILPARFLPRARAEGLGDCLFRDLRNDPGFVLNLPQYRDAAILVAGRNFGCGSSREAAVYALADAGFLAVIAPSFGDIFFANCFKNGVLPIALPQETVDRLLPQIGRPGSRLVVDLEAGTVTAPDGSPHPFSVDPMRRHLLLNGIDEIDYTLGLADQVRAFEQRHAAEAAS